jgi:NAD(P)-dependent dehydrogenase (short-subunit alcohol dehydrogenase family)
MTAYKTILITGSTSGIGHALAEAYAAPGMTLLLTGRSVSRAEEVERLCRGKGAAVEVSLVPVTDRTAFGAQVLAWDDKYKIDLVIANAGISGGRGPTGQETEEQFRQIIATNVDGMFNTVNPLIPRMRARKAGHIALVASLAGYRGMPGAPAYSVSKNAVRAYAEALRPALMREGVAVSVICPGFIKTPMTDVNMCPMPFLIGADEAAQIIKKGLSREQPVIAFPLPMVVLVEFIRCLPRRLGDWMLSFAPGK